MSGVKLQWKYEEIENFVLVRHLNTVLLAVRSNNPYWKEADNQHRNVYHEKCIEGSKQTGRRTRNWKFVPCLNEPFRAMIIIIIRTLCTHLFYLLHGYAFQLCTYKQNYRCKYVPSNSRSMVNSLELDDIMYVKFHYFTSLYFHDSRLSWVYLRWARAPPTFSHN